LGKGEYGDAIKRYGAELFAIQELASLKPRIHYNEVYKIEIVAKLFLRVRFFFFKARAEIEVADVIVANLILSATALGGCNY